MNKRRLFTFALLVSLALVSGSRVAQGSAVPPPVLGIAEARRVEEVSRRSERGSDAIALPGGALPNWWATVQQGIRPSKYHVTRQDQPPDISGNVPIINDRQVLTLNDYTVSSPDGSIVVTVSHDTDSGAISYHASKDGATVIESSSLGIQTDIGDFSSALAYVGQSTDTISETYAIPHGKKSTYVNHSNVLTLTFSKDSVAMDLVVRAYDDGIGYRYHVPGDGEIQIYSESSAIDLPDLEGGWGKEYSENYEKMEGSYSCSTPGEEWAMPVLFELSSGTWVLVSEAAVYGHYAGARIQCETDDRLSIELDDDHDAGNPIVTSRPFYSPWRVAFIASNLGDLVESTLVENLNPPSEVSDPGWIKPGRVAWSWWAYGTDRQSDLALHKEYVDFAAEMGWEYVLVDENWQVSWIQQLVDYADNRGIGILVWYDHQDLDTDSEIEYELNRLVAWGVRGVKVDFFEDDQQDKIEVYDRIATKAAEKELLVNYHGATKPAGEKRRWPHLMTREAVRGAEYYLWDVGPTAKHNTILPFTRNVVGPMDYTPCTYSDNDGQTTDAHQTALAVVFESGLQHLADFTDTYRTVTSNPFHRACPAAWDETRLIEGNPGEHVTMARRSGDEWYVGAIADAAQPDHQIPLSFLDSGSTYCAHIYRDGSTDTEITFEQREVTSSDVLTIPLREHGGSAIRFTPPGTGTYLSHLSWTSATNGWGPVERDMSNGEDDAGDGAVITLDGTTYAKGLGVHANSAVTYDISCGYERFKSDAGVDDEVGSQGSVVFQVYVDGDMRFDSGTMTGISTTQSIDIDVTGANELRLVVTDGGDGIGYDHADWANARLTMDSIPPLVEATAPISGAVAVSITAPLVITFSEPMDPDTFTYTVVPDPLGWSETWSEGGVVATLSHNPFAGLTVHTVTVATAADLAGNPLSGAPCAWHFTTAPSQWVYLPLALRDTTGK